MIIKQIESMSYKTKGRKEGRWDLGREGGMCGYFIRIVSIYKADVSVLFISTKIERKN